jgi:hypothetical protein
MKYDRTHPIWEQACVAAMQGVLANFDSCRVIYDVALAREGKTREPGCMARTQFDQEIAHVAREQADALIAEMNKAIEETTTTENDDAAPLRSE